MVYHSYRGVTDDKFVKAWETSEDLMEVANKTGMPTNNCRTRANDIRASGVPLERLPRRKRDDKEQDS